MDVLWPPHSNDSTMVRPADLGQHRIGGEGWGGMEWQEGRTGWRHAEWVRVRWRMGREGVETGSGHSELHQQNWVAPSSPIWPTACYPGECMPFVLACTAAQSQPQARYEPGLLACLFQFRVWIAKLQACAYFLHNMTLTAHHTANAVAKQTVPSFKRKVMVAF